MEANNIFKKNFKSLKIDKNNSQNLAQQKKLYNHSVVRIWSTHLPSSFFYEEMFSENREENNRI